MAVGHAEVTIQTRPGRRRQAAVRRLVQRAGGLPWPTAGHPPAG